MPGTPLSSTSRTRRVVSLAGAAIAIAAGTPSTAAAVSTPDVAVDASANASFAWVTDIAGNFNIATTRRLTGSTLGEGPEPLSLLNTDFIDPPEVAVAPNGTATFVWENITRRSTDARRRFADGSLGPIVHVGEWVVGDDAHVAVDGNGNAVIMWPGVNNTLLTPKTRTLRSDGTLSATQNLVPAGQSGSPAAVAVTPTGTAAFIWSGGGVFARTRAPNGTLSAIQTLSTVANSGAGEVAVADDGAATFVWQEGGILTAADRIQTRRRSAAGVLGAVTTLSPAGGGPHDAHVAVTGSDAAAFVWARSNGSFQVAQARTRTAANAFTATQGISNSTANALSPRVDIDPSGNATFAWTWSDNFIAQARRRSASTGTIGAVKTLNNPNVDTTSAPIAMDVSTNGDAVFAWRTGTDGLQARRFTAAGTLGPIVDLLS